MIYAVKPPHSGIVAESVASSQKEAVDKFLLLFGCDRKFHPANSRSAEDLLVLLGCEVVEVAVVERGSESNA